jgi:hypothetical protein
MMSLYICSNGGNIYRGPEVFGGQTPVSLFKRPVMSPALEAGTRVSSGRDHGTFNALTLTLTFIK